MPERELVTEEPVNFGWLLEEPLFVRAVEDPDNYGRRVLTVDAGYRYSAVIQVTELPGFDGDQVLLNGEYVDLGDDLPVVLGIVDTAYEAGAGNEVYVEAPEN